MSVPAVAPPDRRRGPRLEADWRCQSARWWLCSGRRQSIDGGHRVARVGRYFYFVVTFFPLQVVAVVVVVVVACVADAVSIQCCHKAVVEKQTRLECSVRLAFAGDSRCRHRLAPICFGAWRQITAAFEPVGLLWASRPVHHATISDSGVQGFKPPAPQPALARHGNSGSLLQPAVVLPLLPAAWLLPCRVKLMSTFKRCD